MKAMGELEMEGEYLSNKDTFFVWVIAWLVSLIFIYHHFLANLNIFFILEKMNVFFAPMTRSDYVFFGLLSIWGFGGIFSFFFFFGSLVECMHPGLMRFTFVFAFIFSLISLSTRNVTLANMAFFSVFLYPFLEWLDISVKIPQNASSTLFFGILQFIALYIISYLIDQLK